MIALQAIDIASNPINKYVYLSIILFSIGVMGVLLRRNSIIILMCVELMLNASNILLVAFSSHNGQTEGQMIVFFVIVVAAAEVAVGLALLISIYRNISSTDINLLNRMKG
jgi:NADH-quinone oxidoreductase subunit K